jgi:hypothetical protein
VNQFLIWCFAVVGALCIGWLLGEILFQYSLQNGVLRITLFGLVPLRRIELQEVREIRRIRLRDWIGFSGGSKNSYWYCERWGGYMLVFRGVAITFQNGKTILIAPRNRNTTVAMLEEAKGKIGSAVKSSA